MQRNPNETDMQIFAIKIASRELLIIECSHISLALLLVPFMGDEVPDGQVVRIGEGRGWVEGTLYVLLWVKGHGFELQSGLTLDA